jgi:hypothetical protein
MIQRFEKLAFVVAAMAGVVVAAIQRFEPVTATAFMWTIRNADGMVTPAAVGVQSSR